MNKAAEQGLNEFDIQSDEIEERKKFFFKTVKKSNWGKIIINLVCGLVFLGYFI